MLLDPSTLDIRQNGSSLDALKWVAKVEYEVK